jgi:hypothetical protein
MRSRADASKFRTAADRGELGQCLLRPKAEAVFQILAGGSATQEEW